MYHLYAEMAQWKRACPVSKRSEDRNLLLADFLLIKLIKLIKLIIYFIFN